MDLQRVILEEVNFGKFGDFSPFAKINFNPPFLLTVCMLNDTCLSIHQIKIHQPQKN